MHVYGKVSETDLTKPDILKVATWGHKSGITLTLTGVSVNVYPNVTFCFILVLSFLLNFDLDEFTNVFSADVSPNSTGVCFM